MMGMVLLGVPIASLSKYLLILKEKPPLDGGFLLLGICCLTRAAKEDKLSRVFSARLHCTKMMV